MSACSFYLVTPIALATGQLSVEHFLPQLREALQGPRIEALLLRTGGHEAKTDEARLDRQIGALLPLAHGAGLPMMLEERADLVQKHGCDGVHLGGDKRRIAAVRQALGPAAIVGAVALESRHAAMEAGEAGADYVSFGSFDPEPLPPDPDLLTWWQEMMELPCVAMGGVTLENAGALAEAGADFLALRNAVWNHPEGPLAAIEAFAEAVGDDI
ncbi:MAG: thiamine phosphate synthase [Rhodospirillales bacterium]